MNFENGTPERPGRFDIPSYLIDDIDTIDEDSIVNNEAFHKCEELKSGDKDKEQEKVVELLKSLGERTGNSYADRKKAEFTIAVLRAMGLEVDFNLIGIGIHPETVAEKMIEERDDQSGYDEPEVDTV